MGEIELEEEATFLAANPGGGGVVKVQCPSVDGDDTLNGQVLELAVDSLDLQLSEFKALIKDATGGLAANKQKLSAPGLGFLTDKKTFAYYNIAAGSTLQLALKERGGRKSSRRRRFARNEHRTSAFHQSERRARFPPVIELRHARPREPRGVRLWALGGARAICSPRLGVSPVARLRSLSASDAGTDDGFRRNANSKSTRASSCRSRRDAHRPRANAHVNASRSSSAPSAMARE